MNEEMSKICRLCLEKVFDDVEILGSLSTKMLEILPIQLNNSLSRSPVMCSLCSKNLQKSFDFKTTFLSRNEYLKTFVIGTIKFVNLQEIITKRKILSDVVKEEDELICRFCLKYCLMEHLTSLSDTQDSQESFLKDMIDRCFPEIDLSITADPLACSDCLESLQHQFNFMAQCCDSDQLIMNYMTFENISPGQEIDLHNVHDYTMKTRCDFENSLYFIKQETENVGTCEETEHDDEFLEETGSKACEAFNKMYSITGSTYMDCGFSQRLGPKDTSGTNYCCTQCPYKTNRRDSLISHLIVHQTSDTIKIHKCDACDFQSKWRTSLTAHLLCHKKLTDLTMYKCNDCAYQSKYKKHLRRHIKTHTSGSIFFCQFCRCRSKYQQNIINHKCKHEEIKQEVKIEPVKVEPVEIEPVEIEPVKIEPVEIKVEPVEPVPEYPVEGSTFTRLVSPLSTQCWWYKCNSCEYETRKSYHMKEHVVKHYKKEEVKLNECDMCNFKTKYRASLCHHKKQVHKKKRVAVV